MSGKRRRGAQWAVPAFWTGVGGVTLLASTAVVGHLLGIGAVVIGGLAALKNVEADRS